MSQINRQAANLKAGEFYGRVLHKHSNSSCVMSEVTHVQPADLPQHSHELGFFTLLLNGSYSESFGRKKNSYNPLTIWWHRPGITHKDAVGLKGAHFFTVEVSANSLARLREITHEPDDFSAHNNSLVWLGLRLYQEFKDWQFCSQLAAEGIVLEMLAQVARENNAPEKRPPAWLLRVVERLSEEFTQHLTTDELALEAGVHPVHLATTFRRFYRETIGDYVQKRRVSYAVELLCDKETPLADIAFSAGFADQSHFTRIFKRLTGKTPGSFRANFTK